jgi:hypothetical protein
MSFRNQFQEPEYQDAPFLSDQLLLPNLAAGNDIHIVSAFAPSYLFRLLRDLASSPEIEPGTLFLTFFVPGNLDLKSTGIARFKMYLQRYAESEEQVAQFIEDLIQINSENKLSFSISHSPQRTPITKGCVGVIRGKDSANDFVAFVDAKGGDFNSPVQPKKSWINEDYFDTLKILIKINEISNGKKGTLVTGWEALSWLEYLSEWYAVNPPAPQQSSPITEEDLRDPDGATEKESELLAYLKGQKEFQKEAQYQYVVINEPEEWWDEDWNGWTVEVHASEAVHGHIPPLRSGWAAQLGTARATCICGKTFTRIWGCPRIDW